MKLKREFIYDPNLVLYLPLWKLDGASFMSQDAYGRLCAATGTTWGITGRTLNGTSDWISIPTITLADNTPWAIAWWMYPQVNTASNTVIGEALATSRFEHRAATTLSYYNTAGFVSSITLGSNILNRWIFMVASSDGTTLTLYEDMVNRGTWSPASIDMTITGIGRGSGGTNYGQGIYGEFWVCNGKGLATTEIQHMYLATKWRYA